MQLGDALQKRDLAPHSDETREDALRELQKS